MHLFAVILPLLMRNLEIADAVDFTPTYCPGEEKTLTCISGGSTIVWRASVFACEGQQTGQIRLDSDDLESGGTTTIECNQFTAMFELVPSPVIPSVMILSSNLTVVVGSFLDQVQIECVSLSGIEDTYSFSVRDITPDLNAAQISVTQVQLSWSVPESASMCTITDYCVIVRDSNNAMVFTRPEEATRNTTSIGTEVDGISINEPYTYTVTAVTALSMATSLRIEITIVNTVPPAVDEGTLMIIVSSLVCVVENVNVSWEQPLDMITVPAIQNYTVTYRKVGGAIMGLVSTNNLFIILRGNFEENMDYEFNVTAVNDIGESRPVSINLQVSPAIASSQVPRDILLSSMVYIEFEFNCVDVTITTEIRRCPVGIQCQCVQGEGSYEPRDTRVVASPNTIVMITDLIPGNTYCYRVNVTDTNGDQIGLTYYPSGGTSFTTLRIPPPSEMNGANLITGTLYECSGSLNGFGGTSKQMEAYFDFETGDYLLSASCRVYGWFVAVMVVLVVIIIIATGFGSCVFGYCFNRKRSTTHSSHGTEAIGDQGHPVYDEVSVPSVSNKMIEMESNIAYGHVSMN